MGDTTDVRVLRWIAEHHHLLEDSGMPRQLLSDLGLTEEDATAAVERLVASAYLVTMPGGVRFTGRDWDTVGDLRLTDLGRSALDDATD